MKQLSSEICATAYVVSGFLTVALSDARANRHGYFRRSGKTIFSAHFTTFWARATASRYSFLVTGSAGPDIAFQQHNVVKLLPSKFPLRNLLP